MRKARSSKEKPADLEVAPEVSTESAPRRRAPRKRRDTDAPDGETHGAEASEVQPPLRPVLTPISRPVRDDELNEVPEDPSAPPLMAERPSAAELASDNGAVVTGADGTPMQVLKLTDL
ncbi:MAG TPA: transcription termination factor Rho, partial [Myxococcaceae bacterium]|nr:transcription termination factor Rho [Myxococcaceae bacterium]